jgi:hypothetical protein
VSEQALQTALERAHARLKRALAAFGRSGQGGSMDEFRAAHEAALSAERALAAALGEPHAVPLDFPVRWDIGAPLPHLLQNDHRTFLLFLLGESPSSADRTYVTVVSPGDPNPSAHAIVEFKGCVSAKMGAPNDEVIEGHPLHGKGLAAYRAWRVVNSPWIQELQRINSVHPKYRPERWTSLSHYLFGFHDCTFECVASSFAVETMCTTIPAALATICQRLVS